MSLNVTANADGSYTVSCNGDEVVVGGAPIHARGPTSMPEGPDRNDGGVRAYLLVGNVPFQPPAIRDLVDMPPDLSLSLSDLGVRRLRIINGAKQMQGVGSAERLRLLVEVEPGSAFELQKLLYTLPKWFDPPNQFDLYVVVGAPSELDMSGVRGSSEVL